MKKILAILVLVLFGTMSYAQWATNGNHIYNTNSGNVGIGTSSPSVKLVVANPGLTGADYAGFICESPNIGTANKTMASFQLRDNLTDNLFNFSFRYRNATAAYEVIQSLKVVPPGGGTPFFREFMYVNASNGKYEIRNGVVNMEFKNTGDILMNNTGGVGIGMTGGTLASGVKLQIAGKVKCQEVEVAVTPWPDHVFQTGYNLLPLSEVEAFVNKNKHLPGVPSELEVAENGVSVGKMSATLLQKVEELTLYMIQLQKENDALKTRVSNLEK